MSLAEVPPITRTHSILQVGDAYIYMWKPMQNDTHGAIRKIIHVDMDAYYASIEQRDNPEYRGKPIVVGGSPVGRGGVVATASYEARRFGIRSAMPSKRALELCPEVIFIYPRFNVYKEVSNHIHDIFRRYTDLIEPLSLDEAYLDVTRDKQNIGSAIEVATRIRAAIKSELQLTASAGVSVNKFVAKIASDINKPDGLTFIGPSRIERFIEELPVEKFFGVGKVTATKMKRMGLFNGADLKRLSQEDLTHHFGKTGKFFYEIVRGIDNREVQPDRATKSMSAEDTFPKDLTLIDEMENEIDKIARVVQERLRRRGLQGKTVTLKIKYHDFRQVTRSKSLEHPLDDAETIASIAKALLNSTQPEGKKIRLLGIGLANFGNTENPPQVVDKSDQLKLF